VDSVLTIAKREYLRDAVAAVKARGVLQRDLAAKLGESEAALSGRLSGARGIPDNFIDKVQEATGIPFSYGAKSGDITPDLTTAIQDMVAQAKRNNNVIDLLVEEVRNLREQLRALQGSPKP
jgi:transcriptional regulator with XRE-family HTH domain